MAELLKPNCLRGCLVTAIIIAFLIVLGIALIVLKVHQLEFAYYRAAIVGNIEISSLPDETKQSVQDALATIEEKGRGQKKTLRKINAVLKPEINSRFFAASLCSFLSGRLIPPSALSDQEKADAELQVRRLYAAMSAFKIEQKDFGEIIRLFPRGEDLKLKKQWTDRETRQVIEKIKSTVDQAAPDLVVAAHYDYNAPLIALAENILALAGKSPATRAAASEPASAPASTPASLPAPSE